MLRLRIRELETQVSELKVNASATAALPNAPATGSNPNVSAVSGHDGVDEGQSHATSAEAEKD